MATCKIHNVRFYKPEVRAIHCMAYESTTRKLALSRSDSSIEIWDLSFTPHIECTLPSTGSVEALAWCKDRLFSTGLHGEVIEYNLATLSNKYSIPLTSGPAWCVGVNRRKTRLAAGTEDGYINVFTITDSGLEYLKLLDKQEGRILCLAWDATGDFIATGSTDSVRLWNVRSGHAIHRMTTGRATRNKETIVWCIAITDDFTVISGDSRGCLCFWSGASGTQLQQLQSHTADVLCLSVAEDQHTVYCSGVDPLIACFTTTRDNGGSTRWVRGTDRRLHDHDVRALSSDERRLFSAGVDGYLAISSFPPRVLCKYPPIMQPPFISVSAESRCLLMRHPSHLEVWRLGWAAPGADQTDGSLQVQQAPIKLLHIATRNAETVVCCALSQDSRWLAYSTPTLVRFFSVTLTEERPRLEKLGGYTRQCQPAHAMLFAPDRPYVVLASAGGEIHIVQMDPLEPTLVHTILPLREQLLAGPVILLAFSSRGEYLVAADHQGNIAGWETVDFAQHCSLPRHASAPTAMAVQPDTDNLVVVYADQKIVEYSLSNRCYTDFSRRLAASHPRQWLARTGVVTGVTFDPRHPDLVLVHDDAAVLAIHKNKKLSVGKIARLESSSSDNQSRERRGVVNQTKAEHAFRLVKKYKHLVYLGWLDDDEMVAVEVTPGSLEDKLPPTLKKKRFGTQ